MSEIYHLSPALCSVASANMDAMRPQDSGTCDMLGVSSSIQRIAELQVRNTATAIRNAPAHDHADISDFLQERFSTRAAGNEYFAHNGQVFSIYSRYSDVVNGNPAAVPGQRDLDMIKTDFATMELPSQPVIDDGMPVGGITIPVESKPGDEGMTPERRADVANFQASRLAARLNGQDSFMHNGVSLSIQDHYIDYREDAGEFGVSPESVEVAGRIDAIYPLPGETAVYDETD